MTTAAAQPLVVPTWPPRPESTDAMFALHRAARYLRGGGDWEAIAALLDQGWELRIRSRQASRHDAVLSPDAVRQVAEAVRREQARQAIRQ